MTAPTDVSDAPDTDQRPPSLPAEDLNLPLAGPGRGAPVLLRQVFRRYTGPRDMDGQLRMAAQLATAKHAIPRRYHDSPGDLLAMMQHAIALDIELTVAWRHVHFNPDGVAGMTAQLMHALVIRAGHKIIPVRVDDKIVKLKMQRCDGLPSGGAQWTLMEAQRARLHLKDNSPWVPYPEDMLWARSISRLCRRWAPDVIMGFYVPEELDSIPVDEIDPADMSTAMTDSDGNLLPAPDVMALLTDLDVKTYDEIRRLWQQASQEGMLSQYAGTIDGIHHTVEELLFEKGTDAQTREQAEALARQRVEAEKAAAAAAATEQAETPEDHAAAGEPAPAPAVGEPVTPVALDDIEPEQAPAGTGKPLRCGCPPSAVMSGGRHQEGCTRRARRKQS